MTESMLIVLGVSRLRETVISCVLFLACSISHMTWDRVEVSQQGHGLCNLPRPTAATATEYTIPRKRADAEAIFTGSLVSRSVYLSCIQEERGNVHGWKQRTCWKAYLGEPWHAETQNSPEFVGNASWLQEAFLMKEGMEGGTVRTQTKLSGWHRARATGRIAEDQGRDVSIGRPCLNWNPEPHYILFIACCVRTFSKLTAYRSFTMLVIFILFLVFFPIKSDQNHHLL